MCYSYQASGGLSFKKTITRVIVKVKKFIISKIRKIKPIISRVKHTNKGTILCNGSIATNGFVDVATNFSLLKDRTNLSFFVLGAIING